MKKFLNANSIKYILFIVILGSIVSCTTPENNYQDCGNYKNLAYSNFPVDCNYTIKTMPVKPTVIAFDTQEKLDAFFTRNETPCEDTSIDPIIDFSKNMLVGIFAGPQPQPSTGYIIKISSIVVNDCEVVIQFYEKKSEESEDITSETTNPYDFVLIPKTDKPIYFNRIEQNKKFIVLGSYNNDSVSNNPQDFFNVSDFNIYYYLNVQPDNYNFEQYNYRALTKNGDFTEILKVIPSEIINLKGQTKTYGSPDTSSGGGVYFELNQEDIITKVYFDINDTEDQSTEIIAFKKLLIEKIASYKVNPLF